MQHRHWFLSCIGNTPLIRLRSPEGRRGGQVWCKLEFMNPAGSSKDRMCLAIVESLESRDLLRHGDVLLEASGGNTAISLAMVAAAKGYALTLVMPDTVPPARKRLLDAYGAKIVSTPPSNGMKGSVDRAVEIFESTKRAVMINQFGNPVNPEVHRTTTGVEILKDLGTVPDVFVAGVGTGGTITGVGELFKEKDPRTRIVAVEPADSAVLSGGNPGPHRIPGIGPGFIPKILNTNIIDHIAVVEYQEAVETAKMMAEQEGIYVGLSSGAAVHVALREAQRLRSDQTVVTVLCDSGERYVCSAS
jgi:cysteine synthase